MILGHITDCRSGHISVVTLGRVALVVLVVGINIGGAGVGVVISSSVPSLVLHVPPVSASNELHAALDQLRQLPHRGGRHLTFFCQTSVSPRVGGGVDHGDAKPRTGPESGHQTRIRNRTGFTLESTST